MRAGPGIARAEIRSAAGKHHLARFLNDKWQVKIGTARSSCSEQEIVPRAARLTRNPILKNEKSLRRRERRRPSNACLGNSSLQNGDPQQARRAFQAAYGLSTNDAAFNEDARVQLHNIKLQQALIGLNARQSAAAGDNGALGGKLRDCATARN
jgi:hypothetical protein